MVGVSSSDALLLLLLPLLSSSMLGLPAWGAMGVSDAETGEPARNCTGEDLDSELLLLLPLLMFLRIVLRFLWASGRVVAATALLVVAAAAAAAAAALRVPPRREDEVLLPNPDEGGVRVGLPLSRDRSRMAAAADAASSSASATKRRGREGACWKRFIRASGEHRSRISGVPRTPRSAPQRAKQKERH